MMPNSYIVKGKTGYYAKLIQQKYPKYKGLDGIIWPLWESDAQKVKGTNSNLCTEIKQCINYNQYNIIGGCTDLNFLNQYISICNKINLPIEVLSCVVCEEEGIDEKEFNVEQYFFLGYDYVLKESCYSPLVQEIECIKEFYNIKLNDNGLLETYSEVLQFVHARKKAKERNNGIGFEFGEDFVDYHIVALFKYIGGIPIN